MDASIIAVCHFSWKCSDYSLERTLSLVHQADTGRAALSIFPKPRIKLSSGHLSHLIYYNLYLFLLPPISGRSNASDCRDCISIEDRAHELELKKGFVVSSRVQGTDSFPFLCCVIGVPCMAIRHTSWRRAAGRRSVARAGRPAKRLFRYAHCMQRGASRHLPLEIVRSGTASYASILPQGQVSAAQTHPAPRTRCTPLLGFITVHS